jgi:hypothetical protein
MLGKVGISKVRKTVHRGNGLLSLFLISLYTSVTDWSSRVDWISSSNMSSSEAVLKMPQEWFKDVCLSTCMG